MNAIRATSNEKGKETGGVLSQYLSFVLAGGEYAVEILQVQEIRGWTPVTWIPNTPKYVEGILNMRGAIVPIVDLRIRFGMERVEYGPTTVIVVLKANHGNSKRIVGIVVDGVTDVHNLSEDDIKPVPDFGETVHTEFIKGMATLAEKMAVVLDVDRLLRYDELEAVDAIVNAE